MGSPLLVAQTSSYFFRKKYFDITYFNFLGKLCGGDLPLIVSLCNYGDGFYVDKVMSEYRKDIGSLSNNRRYGENKQLMSEIVKVYKNMNIYFNYKFNKELKISLKGQFMIKYEDELNMAVDRKVKFMIFWRFIKMLVYSFGTQYSFRDVIWIYREKIKMNKK